MFIFPQVKNKPWIPWVYTWIWHCRKNPAHFANSPVHSGNYKQSIKIEQLRLSEQHHQNLDVNSLWIVDRYTKYNFFASDFHQFDEDFFKLRNNISPHVQNYGTHRLSEKSCRFPSYSPVYNFDVECKIPCVVSVILPINQGRSKTIILVLCHKFNPRLLYSC